MSEQIEALNELMAEAHRAYEIHRMKEQTRAVEDEEKRREKQEAERMAFENWLGTWMPEALIGYVNLDGFSKETTSYSKDSKQGAFMEIEFGAAPVGFRAYSAYGSEEYHFGRWHRHYDEGVPKKFIVPDSAVVRVGEDGDPFIQWRWPLYPQFADLLTAIGAAKHLYDELWPGLQKRWFEIIENVNQVDETADAQRFNESTFSLITDAKVLTQSLSLAEGPRDGSEQLAIAQVLATLAIANEFQRMNDENELERERRDYG